MLDRIVASSRPQFRTIVELGLRDLVLQIVALILLCGLFWSIGHPYVMLFILVSVSTCQIFMVQLLRRKSIFSDFDTDRIIRFAFAGCIINTLLYVGPAHVLIEHPSLAIKITGMMWIMGAQVYLANTWARVPSFLAGMLVAAMANMMFAFYMLVTSTSDASPTAHWGFAACFLALFIYSCFDTLRYHIAAQADAEKSKSDAEKRLAKLEESHRLDPLTGMLNRRAFDQALNVMLDDRKLNLGEITVFLIDLDSFKPINDTYTHEAGDVVLTQTASRIHAMVGQSGIVGRLGGDEFVCALHDLDDAEDVLAFGSELANTITRPIHWNARTLKVAASIGASSTSNGGMETVQSLCSTADQAMFAAKSAPSRGPILYDPDVFAPRMTAEDKQRLIESIADKSLKPYYQPKIHLPTGKIIGLEALARWERETANIRQPAEFIDQINELGLQADFMMSVAGQVVDDINVMLGAGIDPGQVSINVSEVALATHSGTGDLKKIIENNPDAAKYLTFEITEDVFIARAADTIQASIATFRALGVRISLDDFGTGFASFHHLSQLDFDELKIDTTFVAGLGHDPTAEVLVRGFLNIASGLGVSVVAEGVETKAQERDLMNMGCVVAQGFLFSPAVPFLDACRQLEDQQLPLAAL